MRRLIKHFRREFDGLLVVEALFIVELILIVSRSFESTDSFREN